MKTPRPAKAAASSAKPSAPQGAAAAAAGPTESAAQTTGDADSSRREPVLLILDSSLQAVPWESVPGLRDQRFALGHHHTVKLPTCNWRSPRGMLRARHGRLVTERVDACVPEDQCVDAEQHSSGVSEPCMRVAQDLPDAVVGVRRRGAGASPP